MENDRRLMRRVARRDEAAFAQIVEHYGGRLLAVAGRLLGSRTDAEDAVQRAFLQCFKAAASYDPRWALSTWLYRILTNACMDELRRRAASASRDAALAGAEAVSGRARPGDHVDLHRALDRVPPEARTLLALRFVDGLSYQELAQVRGISVNTVKSQLARGKALLRVGLTEHGGSR